MNFTVRQARKYAGMTQVQMAKILGIDRTTYIRIEKDVTRATVGQINRISEVTGIPIKEIFLTENSIKVEYNK